MNMEDLYASFLYCTRKNDSAAVECIESFLARGILLRDIRDKKNNTLLHQAACRGCPQAAKRLLEYGLDQQKSNDQAKTPFSIADDFKGYGKGYKAVYQLFTAPKSEVQVKRQQQAMALQLLRTLNGVAGGDT